jgi:hypothetical protein
MKPLFPRMRHTAFKSGKDRCKSSSCNLSRSGPLSKRDIVVDVKSIRHSVTISTWHPDVRENILVCFNAYSISVAVYVLLRVTHIAPTLAQAKNSAMYLSQFPLIIPTLSRGRTPYFKSARASKLDSSQSFRYVHRAPVHGIMIASLFGYNST